MQAGKLDRRVTLQRPQIIDDGFSRGPGGFTDVAIVWASREDVSDTMRVAAAQVGAGLTTRFQIRWSSVVAQIDPTWRLFSEGRYFAVVAVKQVGRRDGLEISATTLADAPIQAAP